MTTGRRVLSSGVLSSILAVLLIALAAPLPARANEVVMWNETALKVAAAGGQDAIVTTRTLAMVHGAVHDALNAISRRYAAYLFRRARKSRRLARGRRGRGGPRRTSRGGAELRHPSPEGGRTRHGGGGVHGVAEHVSPTAAARTKGGSGSCGRRGHAHAPQGRRCHTGCVIYAGNRPWQMAAASEPGPAKSAHRQSGAGPGYASSLRPGWGSVTPFTLLSASQFWLPGLQR